MSSEDIIRMAREAGFAPHRDEWAFQEMLERFAALVAAAERDKLKEASADLLEALHETVDALWIVDSHAVRFDDTVMFGDYYDFSGLTGPSREEFLAEYECVVWRSNGKWSAYCTFEGSMWFEWFDCASAAKEQCMKLLDRVLPDHPAMRARAAIAKAAQL